VRRALRFFLRTVGLLALLVAALVFSGLASLAYSYLDAETFEDGGEPPARFPLVVASPGSTDGGHLLIHWAERAPYLSAPGSFRLAQEHGQFRLGSAGNVTPVVSFTALADTATQQHVTVIVADDDYAFESRYVTDGNSIQPEYYRVWGASMAVTGLLPGIVAAWLLGLGVRRAWRAWFSKRGG
jgi:hypothetical protein